MCDSVQLKFLNKADQSKHQNVGSWNVRNHEEVLCARSHGLSMSLEDIYRNSYFPEAASAGLRFIKSSGDAKNSHLLKFHWRFQAGRHLKGQFVEAGNPALPLHRVVRLSSPGFFFKCDYLPRASRLHVTRWNQFLCPAVGPCPRTVPGAFWAVVGRATQKGGCRSKSSMKYPRYVLTVRSTVG